MRLKDLLTVLVWFFSLSGFMNAEPFAMPDTPAGKKMADLLAVINSGDSARAREFVSSFAESFRQRFPESEHLRVFADLAQRTGGLDPTKIVESQPAQLTILAKALKTQASLRIHIETQPSTPYAITEIGIVRLDDEGEDQAEEGEAGSNISNENALKQITQFLDQMKARGFTGAVLIAKNGEILLDQGYGLANRTQNIPITGTTVFDIGSNTKDFTHTAILQLAASGKLKLTDPLGKFFPNVPADKKAITVEQLIQHTAGLPTYSGKDKELLLREDFLKRIFATPLISEPGKKENYSNPGYSVLAAIIETVSKESYEQYLKEHIFEAAGMTSTGYALPNWNANRIAHTYSGNQDRGSTIDYSHPPEGPSWNLRGNGGTLSTLRDMYQFYEAVVSGKLIPRRSNLSLFSSKEPVALAGSDGYHFFLYQRMPRIGVTILMATTNAEIQAPQVVRPIVAILTGKQPAVGRAD
jgi:CubicO group peptidase (beta-lactamase class C family)